MKKSKTQAEAGKGNSLEIWLGGLGLVAYVVAAWWPTRKLLFWGELQDWLVVATEELMGRGMTPWAHIEWNTALPPGFASILGLSWNLVGDKILGSHVVGLVAMILLVLGTYVVGLKTRNKWVALLSAFLVGVSPVTVATMGWVSPFLLASGLMMLGGSLWFGGVKWLAAGVFSLAVLVIPSTVLLLPIIWWWSEKRAKDEWKLLLVPVAVWLGFLVYHNMVTGWWLTPPGVGLGGPENLLVGAQYAGFVLALVVLWQLRWLLLVPALVVGLYWARKKEEEMKLGRYGGLGLSLLLLVGYWGWQGGFEEEMLILVFPWMVLAAFDMLWRASKRWFGEGVRGYVLILGALMGLVWLTQWRPEVQLTETLSLRERTDLGYQDRIFVSKQMAAYLEFLHDDAEVYGGSPEAAQLTLPQLGYVSKTLDFSWCRDFEQNSEVKQLVVVHPYHQSQLDCRRLLDEVSATSLQGYESHGRWVEIYQIQNETTPDRQP